MKHIACAVALAIASLAGNALAADSYSVSAYTAPELPANDWRVTSSVDSSGGVCSTADCLNNPVTFTVSNTVTGQSSTFAMSPPSPGRYEAEVNRRGDVLVQSSYTQLSLTLFSAGQTKSLGNAAGSVSLRDDGSVLAELYSAYSLNYSGGLYANGKWHSVAGGGAPNSSAVADINQAEWVAGTVSASFFPGSASSAVISSPTNTRTLLPGVAGYGAAGFRAGANSINDSNTVVGWQANFGAANGTDPAYGVTTYERGDPLAFIWDSANGSRDLNSLIDPSSSLFGKVHLTAGKDIDNFGNIIASGYLIDQPGTAMTFMLSAVPELNVSMMMPLGLLAVAGAARHARRRQA
jgi:hypothetical protein